MKIRIGSKVRDRLLSIESCDDFYTDKLFSVPGSPYLYKLGFDGFVYRCRPDDVLTRFCFIGDLY